MPSVEELVEQIGKLSDEEKTHLLSEFIARQNVLWLSGAVRALEAKFGVTAAAPVAVAAPAVAPAAAAAEPEAVKDSFDVVLKEPGANKLQVIKLVRQVRSDLALKEAKDLVEKGGTVKSAVPKEEAEKIMKELEAAGAKVELA